MKNTRLDIDLDIHQDEDTVRYKAICFIYFTEVGLIDKVTLMT